MIVICNHSGYSEFVIGEVGEERKLKRNGEREREREREERERERERERENDTDIQVDMQKQSNIVKLPT